MPELLPYSFSDDLVQEILDDFDSIIETPTKSKIHKKARREFGKLVKKASGVDMQVCSDAWRGHAVNNRKTSNSDVHRDMPFGIKYLLTVANNNRGSTLYIPNWVERPDEEVRSEELFILNKAGELEFIGLEKIGFDLEIIQAANGQLSRFVMEHEFHVAPPLYPGDQKLLLWAASGAPR